MEMEWKKESGRKIRWPGASQVLELLPPRSRRLTSPRWAQFCLHSAPLYFDIRGAVRQRWNTESLTNVKSRCGAPSFPSSLALYEATSRASLTERYEIEMGLTALYQATAHPACTPTLAPSPRHTCAEGNKLPFIRWPNFTIEWMKFVKDSTL